MRQSEWEKEKAIHILELVRSELYMDMPHFLTAYMCDKWRVFLL